MRLRWLLIPLSLIAATELALRFGVGLGDPPIALLTQDTEYELKGPATYHRWHNRIAINAQGLRTAELAPQKPDGQHRMLLIGDSVIYGGHFLDQSETIAAQMAKTLASANCAPRVLPAAVSSWGPENQAAFLKKRGTFGADWAAIIVSAHDLYDVMQDDPDILPYRTKPSRTALGDAVQAARERLLRTAPAPPRFTPQERRAISLDALTRMTKQLRAAGAKVFLVYHPTTTERTTSARPERQAFQNWARDQGVAFADLGDAPIPLDGYRDTIHPNPLGAEKIAAELAHLTSKTLTCPS